MIFHGVYNDDEKAPIYKATGLLDCQPRPPKTASITVIGAPASTAEIDGILVTDATPRGRVTS